MAQGWHGDSQGHRRAGRLGGLKSAATRRRKAQLNHSGGSESTTDAFGEQLLLRDAPTRDRKAESNDETQDKKVHKPTKK